MSTQSAELTPCPRLKRTLGLWDLPLRREVFGKT